MLAPIFFGEVSLRLGQGAQREGDGPGQDFCWPDGGRHVDKARKCGGGPVQQEVTWHDVTKKIMGRYVFFSLQFLIPFIIRGVLNAHFTRWAKVYSCVNYSKDIDAQNRLRRMIE